MTTIASNMQAVRASVIVAAEQVGRNPDEICVLAVSKNFQADVLREAFQVGQTCFAESYVREAIEKISALKDLEIEWHFIGPIQSNKTRFIAENFSWVHSVDRYKVAERLSSQRPNNMRPLQLCIQVNISKESSKSGVEPSELGDLTLAIAKLPGIELRGLMAIPAPSDDFKVQRKSFALLRELRDQLNSRGLQLDTLSMGMSDDFSAAIAEGSTIVRVGTAIFGKRT